MKKSTAILFLAHFWSPALALRFDRLRKESAAYADTFIVLQRLVNDQLHEEIDAGRDIVRVFDKDKLKNKLNYPYFDEGSIGQQYTHFPVIDFALDTSYDDYWVVEYDVEFTGNWGDLVSACGQVSADLIAAHFFSPSERPHWQWWQSLQAPDGAVPDAQAAAHPVKAFFPLYRISRAALALLDAAHKAGWRGHYEVLVPTLLAHHQLKSLDFLEIGRFYRGTEQDANQQPLSTLRYRPEVLMADFLEDFSPNTIYHPVKQGWTFDGNTVVVPVVPRHKRLLQALADKGYPLRISGYVAIWHAACVRLKAKHDQAGHSLNPTATVIWSLCDGQCQGHQLVDALLSRYPEEPETVTADLYQALMDLETLGLIRFVEQPQPSRPLIKVGFKGFGAGFDAEDNYFLWLLTHGFTTILVDPDREPPDLLLYRAPPSAPFDPQRVDRSRTFTVQVNADGDALDFAECDFAFSPRRITGPDAKRHCQLPAWAYYVDWEAYEKSTLVFSDRSFPRHYAPEQACAHLYAALFQAEQAEQAEQADLPEVCLSPLAQTPSPDLPDPKYTAPVTPPKLTIGMATYDDFDGVYFTIQSLRLSHPEVLEYTEFMILDNHPEGICAGALRRFSETIHGCRYIAYGEARGTASRDRIFREAKSDYVLCVDSHILLAPGAIHQLVTYLDEHPECLDLLQGPLVYDDLTHISTHFDPIWSGGMYGRWGTDERGTNPHAEPFEIPMQGLGIFGCRKRAWLGFNSRFVGFGGEEGYIHEKFRQRGRRILCLPFLRWVHRFQRPFGTLYRNVWDDRIRNYYIGFQELNLPTEPIDEHFQALLGAEVYRRIKQDIDSELANPFYYFDAIYCINLDSAEERWTAIHERFQRFGIAQRVRRFSAIETPDSHHIGCALSHRSIIEQANRQGLQNVLIFEDDAIFLENTLAHLSRSIEELKTQAWQILYLGGHKWGQTYPLAAHCQHLESLCQPLTCTHAVAYHETIFPVLLDSIPDQPEAMREWLLEHHGIDQYLCGMEGRFITRPVVASQPSILAQEDAAQKEPFMI